MTMRLEDATRPELLTVLRSLLQERDELQHRLDLLAEAHAEVARELAGIEREHAIVSQVHVATRLLHRTLDRRQVVTAILEVCINLVGSEQVALFERDDDPQRLNLIASFGVDETAYATVSIEHGAIGDAARGGIIQLATPEEADAADGKPAVCIPLRVGDAVAGVIVMFRLLPHKAGFEQVDFALFDVLSEHAGVALAASAGAR